MSGCGSRSARLSAIACIVGDMPGFELCASGIKRAELQQKRSAYYEQRCRRFRSAIYRQPASIALALHSLNSKPRSPVQPVHQRQADAGGVEGLAERALHAVAVELAQRGEYPVRGVLRRVAQWACAQTYP